MCEMVDPHHNLNWRASATVANFHESHETNAADATGYSAISNCRVWRKQREMVPVCNIVEL